MIEVIATLLRWLQLASNMILVGSCIFLAIAGSFHSPWVTRLQRALPWLGLLLLLGLLGILATTTAQATGITENAWRPDAWFALLQNTRMGHIWVGRALLALLVAAIALYIRYTPAARWRYLLCATVASLTLVVGSLASHAAAEELSVVSILPYALHIILASVWFGALPAFLVVCFACTAPAAHAAAAPSGLQSDAIARIHELFQSREEAVQAGAQALKRFSVMALPVMLAVIATGIIITDRMVDTTYAAMVSTQYGWLLNAKIGLLIVVLLIAARARATWLPLLSQISPQNTDKALAAGQRLRKWVSFEFVLALGIVLLATIVANTVPAKHAIIQNWPYTFRFSLAATWGEESVMLRAWAGIALLLLAGGALAYGRARHWDKKRRIGLPALAAVLALAVGLPPLAIDAYPETYRKTPVPFDTISIANGSTLFAENCVACHGLQGKGNGVLAKTFAKPPVDMLTEPHTAKHTAGDFFHWLTFGIPDTGMPVFADKLSEEERWDVVNFLHAMSRGYQARLMSPRVVPDQPQPSLGPPNFSYTAHDGSSGTLKDFRGQKNVLLVMFSWPASRERMEQLSALNAQLNTANTVLLAVPEDDPDSQEIAQMTAQVPFPVITQGAAEIVRSYTLFRRTLNKPDLLGEGSLPPHLEFLVDRFGYLRARWIPEADGPGWDNTGMLLQQLAQLNREKEILPPPGDHVH
ncbi:putative copper resistance protein D [Nitrosospira multiformis]|uniref:Copper resistance protein D n=1 Tax=Nitrosospira multiformis TaxID=1231 RepID=A0ABY0TLE4_9PROT|nr:CopD family protein [Nitrosospira multiformis]SDQ35848.1 putative copper resistance protein D [Nitrosospira multiformis]SDR01283.1 putative copper resistance protein D [Nitrosospira multiformis]